MRENVRRTGLEKTNRISEEYERKAPEVRIKSLTITKIDQEQCQLLGVTMAGYSLGMADLRIRKVLAKFFGRLTQLLPEC